MYVSAISDILLMEHPALTLMNVTMANTTVQNLLPALTLKVPIIVDVIQGFREMAMHVTILMNVNSLTTTFIHTPLLGVVHQIQYVLIHLVLLIVSAILGSQGLELSALTLMNVKWKNTTAQNTNTALTLKVPMIAPVNRGSLGRALHATIPMNVNSLTINFTLIPMLGVAPQIQYVSIHLALLIVSAILASLETEHSVKI